MKGMTNSHLSVNCQKGIGLLELMISIGIGLFILAGVLQLYATSTQNSAAVEGSSRIQENARYVFNRLGLDISQTGYSGCYSFSNGAYRGDSRYKSTLGQDVGVGEKFDFTRLVGGNNDSGPLNTDTLVLRYASAGFRYPVIESTATSLTISPAFANNFEQFQIAMAGDCSRFAIFMVTNDPESDGTGVIEHNIATSTGPLNEGQSNVSSDLELGLEEEDDGGGIDNKITGDSVLYVFGGTMGAFAYSIGTSAAGNAIGASCSAATTEFCALFREQDELAEGVEDFQIEFGWQNAAGALRFANDATVDWPSVDRIRVTATFNSIESAPTAQGLTNKLTRQYSRVFMVRNQLPGA